jgi:hypothetical protein
MDMIVVDLKKLRSLDNKVFDWMIGQFGPAGQGRWRLVHLDYIEFTNDKDALLFTLRWS